jgi:hypothetical protein
VEEWLSFEDVLEDSVVLELSDDLLFSTTNNEIYCQITNFYQGLTLAGLKVSINP